MIITISRGTTSGNHTEDHITVQKLNYVFFEKEITAATAKKMLKEGN